ncbi:MAG: hypothetical protein MRECE_32c015, partial [Mycoplasmataceae bacterium CE_OT135]
MENWKDIHPDFTEELQAEWESKGFDYETCKEWIDIGLRANEADYCAWLRDVKRVKAEWVLNSGNSAGLREEYQQIQRESWVSIHPSFTKKKYSWSNETYQQEWEKLGITYQEAKEWITAGFKPDDYSLYGDGKPYFNQWKNHNFTSQQARTWIKKGLKSADYIFAYYLIKDGYQPNDLNENNLEQLKKKCSWQSIDKNFCFSERKDFWKDYGFDYQTVEEWKEVLGEEFKPETHWAFCAWVRDEKHLTPQRVKQQKQGSIWDLRINEIFFYYLEYNKLWKDIHKDFAKEKITYEQEGPNVRGIRTIVKTLQQEWEERGLTYQDAQEWISIGFTPDDYEIKGWKNYNFTPQQAQSWIERELKISDYDFAHYLNKDGYQPIDLKKNNLKELRIKCSWQDIHQNFNYQLRKDWENKSFSKGQTKEWITTGTKIDDYEFITWLRDIKKETPEWITNYQADYQILSERFKKYGLCLECDQPNTGEQWCQSCNLKHFATRISHLSQSGNQKVDEFIQKYQRQATDADKFIEWIPYEQFSDAEIIENLQNVSAELQSLQEKHEKLLKKSPIKQLINKSKKKELKEKIIEHESE